jgi:hypothetical protein
MLSVSKRNVIATEVGGATLDSWTAACHSQIQPGKSDTKRRRGGVDGGKCRDGRVCPPLSC